MILKLTDRQISDLHTEEHIGSGLTRVHEHVSEAKGGVTHPSEEQIFRESESHEKAHEATEVTTEVAEHTEDGLSKVPTQLGSRGVKHSTGQSGGHRFDSRRGTVYGIKIVFMW